MTARCVFVIFICCSLSSAAWLEAYQAAFETASDLSPSYHFTPLASDVPLDPPEPNLSLQSSFQATEPKPWLHLLNRQQLPVEWRLITKSPHTTFQIVHEGAFLAAPIAPISSSYTLDGQHTVHGWYHQFRLQYAMPGNTAHYGASYRYVSKEAKLPQHLKLTTDQEQVETWGDWRLGLTQLRVSMSQHWDNVDREPHRARHVTTQGRVTLNIPLGKGPLLGLSYTRGETHSIWEPPGSAAEQTWRDSLGMTVFYHREQWEATFSSTYSSTRDHFKPSEELLFFYYELHVLYRLTPTLSIAPTMRFAQEKASWSQTWMETPSASLLLTYAGLFNLFEVTAMSSYEQSKSNNGYIDTRTLNTTVSLEWRLPMLRWGKTSVSVEMSYSDYYDDIYPENSYGEILGGLSFRLRFS